MKKIALIDYGAGNLCSVENALYKVASLFTLDIDVMVTNDPHDLIICDAIILPGVGSFAACIEGLSAYPNLKETLRNQVITNKKKFLGICVGMQLLAQNGFENGHHAGLGFVDGDVKPLKGKLRHKLDQLNLKIPHMGWNNLNISPEHLKHPLLHEIQDQDFVYFVHSYYFDADPKTIYAKCNYGYNFPSLIIKDNMIGAQFHPEKSQTIGLQFLRNFITWKI